MKSDENYIENETKKKFLISAKKIPSIIVVLGGLKVIVFCLILPTAAMLSASWKERYPEQAEKISSVKRKLFFLPFLRRLHQRQDSELSSQEVCNLIRLPNNEEMNFIFPRARSLRSSISLMRFIGEWGNVDKLQQRHSGTHREKKTYENVSRIPFPI